MPTGSQASAGRSVSIKESCRLIRENYGERFSFKSLSKHDIIEALIKLRSNKASISNDIPISIIKNFATCYCEKLASIFNDCLKENKFRNL